MEIMFFLSDFVLEGDQYFGGYLDQDKYEFNITRYFYQLITNSSYSSKLRLLPVGAAVNANRTIIDNDVKLKNKLLRTIDVWNRSLCWRKKCLFFNS